MIFYFCASTIPGIYFQILFQTVSKTKAMITVTKKEAGGALAVERLPPGLLEYATVIPSSLIDCSTRDSGHTLNCKTDSHGQFITTMVQEDSPWSKPKPSQTILNVPPGKSVSYTCDEGFQNGDEVWSCSGMTHRGHPVPEDPSRSLRITPHEGHSTPDKNPDFTVHAPFDSILEHSVSGRENKYARGNCKMIDANDQILQCLIGQIVDKQTKELDLQRHVIMHPERGPSVAFEMSEEHTLGRVRVQCADGKWTEYSMNNILHFRCEL